MSLPADAVVLSADEAADLSDRVYQVRCAAEDVATALLLKRPPQTEGSLTSAGERAAIKPRRAQGSVD